MLDSGPIHLKPAAELAERVLLPGDPHRALAVAQALLEQPKMFNHHRGLWGYTGPARDGDLLTVQATGMGGPSAAIVIEELIALGAGTLIRIGTCGALGGALEIGEIVAVDPDPDLTAALREACGGRAVTAVSTDLFYDRREGVEQSWAKRGAAVVEMEAATLFQAALVHRVRAGCALGVSDVIGDGRRRIGHEQLAELGVRLGEVAFEALERASSTAR